MTVQRLLIILGLLLLATGSAMLANAGNQGRAAVGEAAGKYAALVNSGAIDQARVDPRLPQAFRSNPNRAEDVAAWLTDQSRRAYFQRELTQGIGAASLGVAGVVLGWHLGRRGRAGLSPAPRA